MIAFQKNCLEYLEDKQVLGFGWLCGHCDLLLLLLVVMLLVIVVMLLVVVHLHGRGRVQTVLLPMLHFVVVVEVLFADVHEHLVDGRLDLVDLRGRRVVRMVRGGRGNLSALLVVIAATHMMVVLRR